MAQNKMHGMLDAIATFQDGADLEPTHDLFSRFEHEQAAREHTEHPKTQLGSVSFVHAKIAPLNNTPNYVQLQNLTVITIKFGRPTQIIISICGHSHISSLLQWIVFFNIILLLFYYYFS